MRACHLVYGHFPKDPRVRREVLALQRAGHEVEVIAVEDGTEPSNDYIDGVSVHRIYLPVRRGGKTRYLYQYATFFLLASALLAVLHVRRHFQLVHVHSLPDFLVFAALLPRMSGARVVLDLHEAMPEILRARFRLGKNSALVKVALGTERVSCTVASRVLVVNEAIRGLLVRRGVPADKLVVVMNSTDLEPAGATPEGLRERLGMDSKRAIVYVGGLNPERDLETLLRAVSLVRRQHDDVSLLVFGSGEAEYVRRIRETAEIEGLSNHFVLGAWVPQEEVPGLISLSELGPIIYEANPLTYLALPTKIFEYAAAGKPLVIADLPTVHSLLGESALYYIPGDAVDLSRQISAVLQDPLRGRKLAEEASRVLAKYSWHVMTNRLLSVYAAISSGGT